MFAEATPTPDARSGSAAAIREHLGRGGLEDTAHSVVGATVAVDLPPLVAAVERLASRFGPGSPDR